MSHAIRDISVYNGDQKPCQHPNDTGTQTCTWVFLCHVFLDTPKSIYTHILRLSGLLCRQYILSTHPAKVRQNYGQGSFSFWQENIAAAILQFDIHMIPLKSCLRKSFCHRYAQIFFTSMLTVLQNRSQTLEQTSWADSKQVWVATHTSPWLPTPYYKRKSSRQNAIYCHGTQHWGDRNLNLNTFYTIWFSTLPFTDRKSVV